MTQIERISVPVATRAVGGATNAYIVGQSPALLVDPPAQSSDLDRVVANREVDHIAVTHTHPDHVGAVATYARKTGATVWAKAGRIDRFVDATGVSPDRTCQEGTEIPLDTPVSVMDTPGHAPDHVAFVVGDRDEGSSTALVGDLLVADGSVFVGATDGDMRSYFVSLRRLLVRSFRRLYPGHGKPVDRPIERIRELLAHRRDRERRVLAAVESGAETVEEILEKAYEKELDGVRDLAAETVRAHLEKLARERHIGWDGRHATPISTGRFSRSPR